MTRGASEIVCNTIDVIRAGFGRIDNSGENVEVEQDWALPGYGSVTGRHRLNDYGSLRALIASAKSVIIEDVSTDARTADRAPALLALGVKAMAIIPIRDHHGITALIFAHSATARKWEQVELTFLLNVGDRLAASVARVEAEALQKILNLELSHRMKNTLAMVQALAKQTLRAVPDQAPVNTFVDRLQALSTAHEALLQQSWQSAKLVDVVRNVSDDLEILTDSMFQVRRSISAHAPHFPFHCCCTNSLQMR